MITEVFEVFHCFIKQSLITDLEASLSAFHSGNLIGQVNNVIYTHITIHIQIGMEFLDVIKSIISIGNTYSTEQHLKHCYCFTLDCFSNHTSSFNGRCIRNDYREGKSQISSPSSNITISIQSTLPGHFINNRFAVIREVTKQFDNVSDNRFMDDIRIILYLHYINLLLSLLVCFNREK